ncbi:MAG TPA: N-6 DNA methylase [Turneriella sp.]|nr:N-6 DNA methylase [Turneriella sp.]
MFFFIFVLLIVNEEPPWAARWTFIQAKAKQPEIGKLLDDAMDAIEKDNTSLKGALPKNYARPALDKPRLGELIDLKADYVLANPPFNDSGWGGEHLREDVRWKYGASPTGNVNFAWVQQKTIDFAGGFRYKPTTSAIVRVV